MNNARLIITDADAIVSFVTIGDANHTRAKAIMQKLASSHAHLLFPTTAICEAVTVLQRKLNNPDNARYVVSQFQSGNFAIHAVDQDVLADAATFFTPHGSKKNTLFDAVIAALAKRLQADAIFSFDEWYRKIGLVLTDDLIEHSKEAA